MTDWISTPEANRLSDCGLTDRRFRDKYNGLIRCKLTSPNGLWKWDRSSVCDYFGVKEETRETADATS